MASYAKTRYSGHFLHASRMAGHHRTKQRLFPSVRKGVERGRREEGGSPGQSEALESLVGQYGGLPRELRGAGGGRGVLGR